MVFGRVGTLPNKGESVNGGKPCSATAVVESNAQSTSGIGGGWEKEGDRVSGVASVVEIRDSGVDEQEDGMRDCGRPSPGKDGSWELTDATELAVVCASLSRFKGAELRELLGRDTESIFGAGLPLSGLKTTREAEGTAE